MSDTETLTDKQAEAMDHVCQLRSSKEIARILGISPRSVDQRIDAARQKLGAATRTEAARIYAEQKATPYSFPGEPFRVSAPPLPGPPVATPRDAMQFEDTQPFTEGAPWKQSSLWRIPELRPRDVGPVARIIVMMILALGTMLLVTQGLDLARSLGLMFGT